MNDQFLKVEQQSQENSLFGDQVDYVQDPLYYDNVFALNFGTPEQKENSQDLTDWNWFGQANPDSVRDVIKKNMITFESFYNQKATNADGLEEQTSTNALNEKKVLSHHPEAQDTSNHVFLSDNELEASLRVDQELLQEENFLTLREDTANRTKRRADMEMKKACRRIKQFYKVLFKSQNPEIIKRRYINCDSQVILQSMKETLLTILPEDDVTDELTYFTIGIWGIKQSFELEWLEETAKDIYSYSEAAKRFTMLKFKLWLNSTNLQTLWRGFISQNEGDLSDILQRALDKASSLT